MAPRWHRWRWRAVIPVVPARRLTPTERELLEINKTGFSAFVARCDLEPDAVAETVPRLVSTPAVRLRARGRTDSSALLRALIYELREILEKVQSGKLFPLTRAGITGARLADLVDGLFMRDSALTLSEARTDLDPPDRPDRVRRTEEPWLYQAILDELERRGELDEEEIGLVDDRPVIDLAQFPRELWVSRKIEVFEELHARVRGIVASLHNLLLPGLDRSDQQWREDGLHALYERSRPLEVTERSEKDDGLGMQEFGLASDRHGNAVAAYLAAERLFKATIRERELLDYAAREDNYYAFVSFLEQRPDGRVVADRWHEWLDCSCESTPSPECPVHTALALYRHTLTLLGTTSSPQAVSAASESVQAYLKEGL